MPGYDRVLIHPSRNQLLHVLAESVTTINGRSHLRTLSWPLPEIPALLDEIESSATGLHQYNGGAGRGRSGEDRSIVVVVWWADRLARKHIRVVGRRGKFSRPQLNHLLDPGGNEWPALMLLYKDFVFVKRKKEEQSLVVACTCGAFGAPEEVGWMGTCCGPCHDRCEEGAESADCWPDPRHTTIPGQYLSLPYDQVLACSADGRTVAASEGQGRVKCWDVLEGKTRWIFATPGESGRQDGLTCATFTPCGRYLLTGNRDGQIHRWDVQTGQRHDLFRVAWWVHTVVVSPDGDLVATADPRSNVSVWETSTGRMRFTRLGSLRLVEHLAFSPDGTMLAGGNHEGRVRLWDMSNGAERPGLDQLGGRVHGLSFSPDSETLAVGCDRQFTMMGYGEPVPVVLLDVARQSVRSALGGGQIVHCCEAFTPDGRFLVTGDGDRLVRIWEVATGEEVFSLRWHQREVCAVTFSPDGQMLATCGADGTVKLWPWEVLRPK
jgi:hypothetical protein